MTSGFKLKSLRELCFSHITTNLEQYSTDVLSLLPKNFRERLVRSIPVLDVCRLEECSSFTVGIDMETLWKYLCSIYIHGHTYKTPELTWRELFFKRLFDAVIQGDRPYGYFHVLSRAEKRTPWISRKVNEDRPVSEHVIDFVNFLVATKRNVPAKPVATDTESEADRRLRDRYGPVHGSMSRHEVTLINGSIPPGQTYHKSCYINQLVPSRYTNLFPEGSCYLPDSIALQMIIEKCHYRPKHLHIDVSEFSTFILNVENDCGSLDCLKSYFEGVESVSIQGVIEKSQRTRIISGAKYGECKGVAGRVLKLILQAPYPLLSSLKVSINTRDDVLNSIEPVLVSYGGLQKFSFVGRGDDSPNFQKLNAIVEYQQCLSTLSFSINEVTEVYNPFHRVTRSPVFSKTHFLSWIQACFKSPSLQEVQLDISPITTQLIFQVLTVFLSTPCSREQTFILKISLENDRPESPWLKPSMPPLPSLKGPIVSSPVPPNGNTMSPVPSNGSTMSPVSSKDLTMSPVPSNGPTMSPVPPNGPTMSPVSSNGPTMSPVSSKDPTMPPVPPPPPPLPVPTQPSVPPTYRFDDAITLKYKCLVFDHWSISESFIEAFFSLAPLKLKKMSFRESRFFDGINLQSRITADPLIEIESLELLR